MEKKVGSLGKYADCSWGLLSLVLSWYRVLCGYECHVRIGFNSSLTLNSRIKRVSAEVIMSGSFGIDFATRCGLEEFGLIR